MPDARGPQDTTVSFPELIAKGRAFLQLVWDERSGLLRPVGLAGLIAGVIAFGSAPEFRAQTKILPYRSGASGVSSLSSIAGLAGIRLPSGAIEQTITAELYPVVATSQDFRITVAETPLSFASLGQTVSTIEYFRDHRRLPLLERMAQYTVGLPGEMMSKWQATSTSGRPDSASRLPVYDRQYLKLVNKLSKRLTIAIDRKTTVITITGTMPDPYAAADLVRVTSDRLMARIIDFESRKAGEQFRFVNEQFLVAKGKYERAQRELASFADRNRALMSATAQIERDRLQRDYDLTFEVYQQFSREVEQARIKMNQDTPVFTVIEQVMVPTNRASPKRAQIFAVGLLLGVMWGVVRIGMRQLIPQPDAPRGPWSRDAA